MSKSTARRALTRFSLFGGTIASAAVLAALGCHGGGHHGAAAPSNNNNNPSGVRSAPQGIEIGTPTADQGVTVFLQTIDAEDGEADRIAFPGQSNGWDLEPDFSVNDGGDDQLDGAMRLAVNGDLFPGQAPSFPDGQGYNDLTWYTPDLTTADGVRPAAVVDVSEQAPPQGNFSALFGSAETRLEQTITIPAGATSAQLTYALINAPQVGFLVDTENEGFFQVDVRDVNGTTHTNVDTSGGAGFALDAPEFRGAPITLSFHARTISFRARGRLYFGIDAISVDADGAELVQNGGFETGDFSSWTVSLVHALYNVRSAPRDVQGVQVTRSFFAQPDRSWGRWTDEFVNNGSAAQTVTLEYLTDLGSDKGGIIYETPNTGGQAITTWDDGFGSANASAPTGSAEVGNNQQDRDVGFYFGRMDEVVFTSEPALGALQGDEIVRWRKTITLQPGQRQTIVNYAVLDGHDTGRTATTVDAKADAMDAEVRRIVDGISTNPEFWRGMTQEQISTIVN